MEGRVCERCGEPISSTKAATARFCSPVCQAGAARERRAASRDQRGRVDAILRRAGEDAEQARVERRGSIADSLRARERDLLDRYRAAEDGDE
ncbi:MAG: hypothetical protein ACR2KV_09920 [Solirubrobacteraceae bacterium]